MDHGTTGSTIPTASRTEDERDHAYERTYDQVSHEMWTRVEDADELTQRLFEARQWLKANPSLCMSHDDTEGHARWDAYQEAIELLMPAVATKVLVREAQAEGMQFAIDVVAVHAAIAADETIPASERLQILSGMSIPGLVEPAPVRPDCPRFCRAIHREKPDETVIHTDGPAYVFSVPMFRESPSLATVNIELEWAQGDPEPVVRFGPADTQLDATAAFRAGVELIRRSWVARRALDPTVASE